MLLRICAQKKGIGKIHNMIMEQKRNIQQRTMNHSSAFPITKTPSEDNCVHTEKSHSYHKAFAYQNNEVKQLVWQTWSRQMRCGPIFRSGTVINNAIPHDRFRPHTNLYRLLPKIRPAL